LVQFLGYLHNKAGFRTTPQIKPIADAVTLALVGDWGTGYWRQGTGAEGVATHLQATTRVLSASG
jgi:hypothetical protein